MSALSQSCRHKGGDNGEGDDQGNDDDNDEAEEKG